MVNWDEIKKELKKLTPEKALEYLQYLLKTIKDKEILSKIEEEIEDIKKIIEEKKDWKKQGEIVFSQNISDALEEISKERPVRRELDLEKTVNIIEKDLNIKEEEKGVDYNKGGSDYGKYLIERLDTGYEKPTSTFETDKLIERPELRQLELIKQQRKGGYGGSEEKKEKKEEFKYETDVTKYKRKRE